MAVHWCTFLCSAGGVSVYVPQLYDTHELPSTINISARVVEFSVDQSSIMSLNHDVAFKEILDIGDTSFNANFIEAVSL